MRNTKIVCTIGPASESEEMLEKLMRAGMNVARLNFSHGDHEEHLARIKLIRNVAKRLDKHIGILLDTKGPEIRTHNMKDGVVHLKKNQELGVHMNEVLGDNIHISITYGGLIHDVKEGDEILIDDGIITLKITSIDLELEVIRTIVLNADVVNNTEVDNILNINIKNTNIELEKEVNRTIVLNKGEDKNKKWVNVPQVKVNLPSMTDKDERDILFGIEHEVDFIAPSFIRKKDDVLQIRQLLEE